MCTCAAVLSGVVAVSAKESAKPDTSSYYEGKAAPSAVQQTGVPYGLVRLRVSKTGRGLDFRGPMGACRGVGGAGPYPSFFGRIRTVAVSGVGKFSGKLDYTEPVAKKTLFWSVQVAGRFVSQKAAKGTVTYEMQYELQGVPGRQTCGRKTGSWSAKLCAKCNSVLGYKPAS